MKKRRNIGLAAAIYLILFGVFNMLVFTVFRTRTTVFWVSYAFMTIAFVVQIISMVLSFKTFDVETAFFGIPLASFSIYYIFVALAVGAIFMAFQNASVTLAVVIQVLIVAIFSIIAIISIMTRDTVRDIADTVKQNVILAKSIHVDIDVLEKSCEDPQLKAALRRTSETVKYSDPISNATVESIDKRIVGKVAELQECCIKAQVQQAINVCSDLETLYHERNNRLLISK